SSRACRMANGWSPPVSSSWTMAPRSAWPPPPPTRSFPEAPVAITDPFIRRPVLACVVSLLLLLLGVQAFQNLAIRQYPQMESVLITVTRSEERRVGKEWRSRWAQEQ